MTHLEKQEESSKIQLTDYNTAIKVSDSKTLHLWCDSELILYGLYQYKQTSE